MNTPNETVNDYLAYVKSQLSTIDKTEAIASYDTGYNLHITNRHLGDECHCMDVMHSSILKIRPPNINDDFNTWERAWKRGKTLVRKFIG